MLCARINSCNTLKSMSDSCESFENFPCKVFLEFLPLRLHFHFSLFVQPKMSFPFRKDDFHFDGEMAEKENIFRINYNFNKFEIKCTFCIETKNESNEKKIEMNL